VRSPLLSGTLLVALCFTAASQETRYTPQGGVRPSKGKVDIESVRLLAAQELFDSNIPVEKLAAFIQDAENAVTSGIPADASAFGLLVQITLTPSARPKFDLFSQGEAPKKILQDIYDSLQKSPDIRSKADTLPFQIHFVIKARP
jgi:hypothetical protein